MEHKESSVDKFERFTWKIENFSRLTNHVYYQHFVLDGYPWTICLYPKGDHVDNHISIFLHAKQTANMSEGWNRDVKFKLLVFNQLDTNMTVAKSAYDSSFNAENRNRGFRSFMTLTKLCDPKAGFIVKDACIVGVEVFVRKATHEKRVIQTVNLTTSSRMFGSETGQMEVQVPSPKPKGRNLETLLSFYPPIFIDTEDPGVELELAALGRVLYFLKTRKVKDMTEEACSDLEVFWDHLKRFEFDLTWLEPHVESALGMKSYVERVMQVEKLKEDVVVLKLETEKLEAKLVAAEINLDVERDLLKAKGFEEIDLDSELGFGSWKPKIDLS